MEDVSTSSSRHRWSGGTNLLFSIAILCGLVFIQLFPAPAFGARQELVFLTWSEYIDPAVVADFEKKYRAKIKFVYFENDENRDDLLVRTDGKGYDLILSNGPSISKYHKLGWLQPVTQKEVPNLKYIDKKWIRSFSKAEGYSVPYFWGTTGIAYRKDLVKGKVDSWKDLLQPKESLRGKITMIGSSVDTISPALKMLGYPANTDSPKAIKEAGEVLKAQKPFVNSYAYISLGKDSALLTGDIYMTIAYSGDALTLKEQDDNVEYVLPKEGGMIWIDSILVGKHSKNRALAYAFLNFINIPENAKRLAEFVNYATPNKAAEKLLGKEFLGNPIIYPSPGALARSETEHELSPKNSRLRNQIFSDLIK